jgi:hypothetical protein
MPSSLYGTTGSFPLKNNFDGFGTEVIFLAILRNLPFNQLRLLAVIFRYFQSSIFP